MTLVSLSNVHVTLTVTAAVGEAVVIGLVVVCEVVVIGLVVVCVVVLTIVVVVVGTVIVVVFGPGSFSPIKDKLLSVYIN